MLYALTQPERELLSNRYSTRITQHMHDQTTSVETSHWVNILCYSLAKHARFCKPGFVTFPDAIFNFFVEELVEDNWGKVVGFLSVKDVDLIQSNLKSVSIFSYYSLFFG